MQESTSSAEPVKVETKGSAKLTQKSFDASIKPTDSDGMKLRKEIWRIITLKDTMLFLTFDAQIQRKELAGLYSHYCYLAVLKLSPKTENLYQRHKYLLQEIRCESIEVGRDMYGDIDTFNQIKAASYGNAEEIAKQVHPGSPLLCAARQRAGRITALQKGLEDLEKPIIDKMGQDETHAQLLLRIIVLDEMAREQHAIQHLQQVSYVLFSHFERIEDEVYFHIKKKAGENVEHLRKGMLLKRGQDEQRYFEKAAALYKASREVELELKRKEGRYLRAFVQKKGGSKKMKTIIDYMSEMQKNCFDCLIASLVAMILIEKKVMDLRKEIQQPPSVDEASVRESLKPSPSTDPIEMQLMQHRASGGLAAKHTSIEDKFVKARLTRIESKKETKQSKAPSSPATSRRTEATGSAVEEMPFQRQPSQAEGNSNGGPNSSTAGKKEPVASVSKKSKSRMPDLSQVDIEQLAKMLLNTEPGPRLNTLVLQTLDCLGVYT